MSWVRMHWAKTSVARDDAPDGANDETPGLEDPPPQADASNATTAAATMTAGAFHGQARRVRVPGHWASRGTAAGGRALLWSVPVLMTPESGRTRCIGHSRACRGAGTSRMPGSPPRTGANLG